MVLGDYDALARIAEMVPDMPGFARKSTEEIFEISNRIRHPDDMICQHANDLAKARERLPQFCQSNPDVQLPDFIQAALPGISVSTQNREDFIAAMLRESQPEVGEWPAPESPGLSVAFDLRSGAPLSRAHIVILPNDDPCLFALGKLERLSGTGISCRGFPLLARPVWRRTRGIESRAVNIRVRRRPKTRCEALDLAREQYSYCSDIVDQGVGTLNALAAALMGHDWWYFW